MTALRISIMKAGLAAICFTALLIEQNIAVTPACAQTAAAPLSKTPPFKARNFLVNAEGHIISAGEAQANAPASNEVKYKAPQSVADLTAALIGAVVNISTSQTVKGTEGGNNLSAPPPASAPDKAPFQQYFQDFFSDKDGKGTARKSQSLGSGFIIDAKEGLVVTNNHVIDGADDIEVNFSDGSKLKAKLVGKDGKTDIALLKIDPSVKKLHAVQFGDSAHLRIGDWVMAIGNPFGFGGTVTLGIVSARNRNINSGPYDDFIQTDAAINRGNSGGPLFDMNGKVIGINTAIISPSGGSIGIGFAIPSDEAIGVVDQLRKYGETRRGWLAVRIQPVTPEIASALGLKDAAGAVVSGRIEEAKGVGNKALHDGDVILRFGDKQVKDARLLPRMVAETPVGSTVPVGIWRNGKEETVNVKLGLLDEKADSSENDEPPADSKQKNSKNPAKSQNSDLVLGMRLGALDDAARKQYSIAKNVEGVVILAVAPESDAAQKHINAGNVIVDVNQEAVKTVDDVRKRLEKLKDTGRRNALLLIASPNGNLRFLTLLLD